MAEEVKREKKKVYVETTVVSDATALPTNDLTLVGQRLCLCGDMYSADVTGGGTR